MNENNNFSLTHEELKDSKVVTQEDIKNMKPEKLLAFLRQYEGAGRSQRFTDDAATNEKKKDGISYKYDFSWSWLKNQVYSVGIEYSDGAGCWNMRSDNTKQGESVYTICLRKMDKTQTKKRTIEADTDVWREWDKMLIDVPCKSAFYSAALSRFMEDMRAGKIGVTLDIG